MINSKTIQQIHLAHGYETEGQYALGLLHLNAAAVFASQEVPEYVPIVRDAIEGYRIRHRMPLGSH